MSDKAIFLDRDDTLIEDPGYINDPDQVKLLGGVPESLVKLKGMGYKLVVVSNQSAVARGIVTEEVLAQIHDRLTQLLSEKGASLDRIYYCPYHPDGVIPKYRKESELRKPNPGMLLTAADEMDLNLGQCWMIGNSDRDIATGARAGCKTILIDKPSPIKKLLPCKPNPDYRAVNIKEVVNIIKKHNSSPVRDVPRHNIISKNIEKSASSGPAEQIKAGPNPTSSTDRIEQSLAGILEQLRKNNRAELFGEFSMMRLLAGIVQIIVLFCLLISIWFLLSPDREDTFVFITLGFAMVLQVMSLTFYIMQERKQ
ncbi:MAG: D-glycero-alpha-D-manno-heptose-1,7-bisphosphate 7-phosphatase [Planctomycetota bacterium]|jgi:D-glycero-D-manno-heptose 1,7-bisphosphate phosphatase